MNFVDYWGMINAIPTKWKNVIRALEPGFDRNTECTILVMTKYTGKICNKIYWKIISKFNNISRKIQKWENTIDDKCYDME